MAGGRGGLDPEEMQRILRSTQFIAKTPTVLRLVLRPDAVVLNTGRGSPLRLGLDEDETAVHQEEVEYFAGAEWTEDGLIIRTKVDQGGSVKDRIQVDENGLLVVKREIDAIRGGKVEGTLIYRRSEG